VEGRRVQTCLWWAPRQG